MLVTGLSLALSKLVGIDALRDAFAWFDGDVAWSKPLNDVRRPYIRNAVVSTLASAPAKVAAIVLAGLITSLCELTSEAVVREAVKDVGGNLDQLELAQKRYEAMKAALAELEKEER